MIYLILSIICGALISIALRFAEGKVPLPDFWGGYRIVPHHMEFWQGGPGRVHDRFMYSLQPDGSWSIERLQP